MDLNKIKKRMNEAGVASFGKKMNACMDAADLETGAAVGTAKDACKTAETEMFTKATGKIRSCSAASAANLSLSSSSA